MREDGYFLDLFKVTRRDMETVTAAAMSGGASYADLYFEQTVYRNLVLRDGDVSSGGFHIDYGVGIRALDGEKTGYSYCETTRMGDMLRAARAAASIGGGKCSPTGVAAGLQTAAPVPANDFYPGTEGWEHPDVSAICSFLKRLGMAIESRDGRISKTVAAFSASDSSVMMFNSLGELCTDTRPMCSISAMIVFSDGRTSDSRSTSLSFRKGPEMLADDLVRDIAEHLCSGIDNCLAAGRPKGGKMPVVMGAGASGILLHEAMGHAFEADFNRKGQSVFCGKMGRKICSSEINIVDDATVEFNRGACNFDDEGVPGQKTYMVKDGILNSYLHDRISASHFSVKPTGNGRRESFRFYPIPRMRLTYMENGRCSAADIISSVKKGIYVDEFSNGQVNIGQGDFTFFVKSGFLIESGRLTRPVKDINVIGNGPRALEDITAVGDDLKISNGRWTCGKDQSVPVGCGMPTVLVRELNVGGE